MNTRTQLSLFVPPPHATELEAVRRVVDPVQFHLIAAHVTLAREDELADIGIEELEARLARPEAMALTLTFGRAEPFSAHGILLPCIGGEEKFQALRSLVLDAKAVKRQDPHITLAHPRNRQAPGNNLPNASRLSPAMAVTFTSICRIQQVGSAPWQVLQRYSLAGAPSSQT